MHVHLLGEDLLYDGRVLGDAADDLRGGAASPESKKPGSCRSMACRYRRLIRRTCLSLVRLQQ